MLRREIERAYYIDRRERVGVDGGATAKDLGFAAIFAFHDSTKGSLGPPSFSSVS
jgi:hypothetical protein